MLFTTRAIVLKAIRHGDNTVILRAYTETAGLRSLLVRVGRRGAATQAALQPLNRLEVVADEVPEKDLLSLRELRVERPYAQLPFDAVRGSLALFVQEVLYKVLREESADADMFAFMNEALEAMDTAPDVRNFPLVFLLGLCAQLGFLPAPPLHAFEGFDLLEGEFVGVSRPHGHTMGPPLSTLLAHLLPIRFDTMHLPAIPASQRRELLDHMLLYLRMHVPGSGELRSPAILHQALG